MAIEKLMSSGQSIGARKQEERTHAFPIGARQTGFRDVREKKLAHGLGWFSICLGIAQLVAPRSVGRMVGINDNSGVLRVVGLREIASGIGILAQPQPARWLWSRVGGDVMDLTLLGLAMRSGSNKRSRIAGASAAVIGIAALDLLCSERVSSHPKARLEGVRKEDVIGVEKSIAINRSAEECYQFWRNFENLPRFMKHLHSVRIMDEKRSHWVAKAPAGRMVKWDAEITDDRPNELIAWRSLQGAEVENSGFVRFERAPGGRGAIVRVDMQYKPPGGVMSSLVAKLFGEEPEQQVREDLRRFKHVMETGEVPTTEGQPAGHRSASVRLFSKVRL
jgi:uncharacterized membrane protein